MDHSSDPAWQHCSDLTTMRRGLVIQAHATPFLPYTPLLHRWMEACVPAVLFLDGSSKFHQSMKSLVIKTPALSSSSHNMKWHGRAIWKGSVFIL